MSHEKAKKQLSTMLGNFTLGSILHLLADICRDSAKDAQRQRDDRRRAQFETVEQALTVVGYGVDAACPR